MKRLLTLSLGLLFFSAATAQTVQTNTEYRDALRKMLKAAGQEETFRAGITQIMTIYKQQKSDVPASFWSAMETEMASSLDDLTEMLVPVYQKHLSLADLKQIIQFYESPAGKKLAQKNPLITQESMQVGQQWGMKIGQRVAEKLAAGGY